MSVCRSMHDAVNALTVEDEKKQIASLICGFINKVTYGRDFEQQLNFYVEARGCFCNLDHVLVVLVQCVNCLAIETHRIVRDHTRKTAAFVRACAAYCFITIPSLSSSLVQLQLYLLSGQVALQNQCLGQADACFKAVISQIPQLQSSLEVEGKHLNMENFLLSFVNNFLSTLLVVPDAPDQGMLYLLRGLINVLQNYTWNTNSTANCMAYISILTLLASLQQDNYLYHMHGVDSNDRLYGSDPKFLSELDKMGTVVLNEIFAHLKLLGDQKMYKRQSYISLELLNKLVSVGDLQDEQMSVLAVRLWNLAQKYGAADVLAKSRIVEYLKHRSESGESAAILLLKNMAIEVQ